MPVRMRSNAGQELVAVVVVGRLAGHRHRLTPELFLFETVHTTRAGD